MAENETDFATYGDMEGLTKLEVIIALEELIDEKGLRKEALAKIESFAEDNNFDICDDCELPVIPAELEPEGDFCRC